MIIGYLDPWGVLCVKLLYYLEASKADSRVRGLLGLQRAFVVDEFIHSFEVTEEIRNPKYLYIAQQVSAFVLRNC